MRLCRSTHNAATVVLLVLAVSPAAVWAAPGAPTPRAELAPAFSQALYGSTGTVTGPGLDSVVPPSRQDALLACADAACTNAVLSPISTDLALLDVDALLVVRREGNDVRLRQVLLMDGSFVEGRAPVCGDAVAPAVTAALRMLASGGGQAPACASAQPAPVAAAPVEKPQQAGFRWPTLAGAIGLAAGGGAFLLLGVVAAGLAVVARLALTQPAVVGAFPTPGLRKTPRFVVVQSPPYVLAGAAVLGVVVGAVLCGAGAVWLALQLGGVA